VGSSLVLPKVENLMRFGLDGLFQLKLRNFFVDFLKSCDFFHVNYASCMQSNDKNN